MTRKAGTMGAILTDRQRDGLVDDLLGIVFDVRRAVHDDAAGVDGRALEAVSQIASTLLYEDGRRSADADGGEAAADHPSVEAAL